MKVLRERLLPLASVVLVLFIVGGTASGQTSVETMRVEDPRPLGAAVLNLLQHNSALITYEDPQYEFSGDIRDVTREVRRDNRGSASKVLAPRHGVLQATLEVFSDSGRLVDLPAGIQALVTAENATPMGGRFEVRQNGSVFHIVPTEARDVGGAWVKQQLILDTRISLSTDELNGVALLEAILREVSEASGSLVGLSGSRFNNLLFRYRGAIQAENEPARDVLLRAMQSINPRLTWLLYNSPSLPFSVFNLAIAAEPPIETSELPEPFPIPRQGDPTPTGTRFGIDEQQ